MLCIVIDGSIHLQIALSKVKHMWLQVVSVWWRMPCRHTSLCCITQGPVCWHVWLKGGLKQGLSAYPTWDKIKKVFQNHLKLFHEFPPSKEKLITVLCQACGVDQVEKQLYWLEQDAFAGKHGGKVPRASIWRPYLHMQWQRAQFVQRAFLWQPQDCRIHSCALIWVPLQW